MTIHFSITPHWVRRLTRTWQAYQQQNWKKYPTIRALCPDRDLPSFVNQCPVTRQTMQWLRLIAWEALPSHQNKRHFGREAVPQATYIAAFLVKIEQQLTSVAHLRRFLVNHPALVWALGFPLIPSENRWGFDASKSVPTRQHLTEVLRELPNEHLQKLLSAQVKWLQKYLPDSFGQTVSLDTKHILAWVKENNPKAFIKEKRFDRTTQPVGDPDCKVGCKKRHNRQANTPTTEGKPASKVTIRIGEFYWGYASGAVVTKVPEWGEFVLAEMTQTFNKGDTTYFFPLMTQVEERLGFRPRYGTFDAAYDAFYIYDYFHSSAHDGFAAVPFSEKGGKPHRQFDEDGLPLCEAGLAMPKKFSFNDRTTAIIPYRRARHVCPLLYPEPNGLSCPIAHKKWKKGGCKTHLADTAGSRIRHQLDRDSQQYKTIYAQRTAVERIFAQAVHWGMERPKLRNQQAIANQNTLIYLLVNVRAMRRILAKLASYTEK